MAVKVSAKLTKEEQAYNGLDPIRAELVTQPQGRRYAIVAFEVLRIQHEVAEGEDIPTIRLVHIEPLRDDAAEQARQLLDATYQERTGRDPQMQLDFGVGDRDEPTGEEILAERREREAAEGGEG